MWWFKRIVAAVGALLTLLAIYGILIEPRLILDEKRFEAAIPGLEEPWVGAEVAVFSDLQVGMWWANEGMIERIVDRVVEENPAAVLIVGDFLYSGDPDPRVQIDKVLELLQPLTAAGIPTYAVLGNHDYATGAAEALAAALEQNGIPVLQNESALLPTPPSASTESPLYAVGLGAAVPDLVDVNQALREVPDGAPRVVLMHNPTSFPRLPPHGAPIALAGHTHCGQVALPGTPHWSYMGLTEEEKVVADGFAPPDYGEPGNRLFVTCGVGFSLIPARINAPPQLVFVKLRAA